jgi:hypothetical protein
MIRKLPDISKRDILIFTAPVTILLFVIILCIVTRYDQQFSNLAYSLLHGHTNFINSIPNRMGEDGVLWHGKYYWALGPFPAILLMPFVALFSVFHIFFFQGYLQVVLILGVLYFVYKLARILHYSNRESLILSFGFALGSVFIGVAYCSVSWYFAQVLTTFLLFWSLYEFYTNRRWWLLGLICGLLLMTRTSAAAIIVFFVLELWFSTGQTREKLIRLMHYCIPLLLAVFAWGFYNFIRFHNPLQEGYGLYQLLVPSLTRAKAYGIFGLIHVPGNLYAMFLSAPLPVFRDGISHVLKFPYIVNNQWGMSIFITSPYLVYLFWGGRSILKNQKARLLAAAVVSCVMICIYYGVGYRQFGYRYSLDFMPELFMIFMLLYREKHKRLTSSMTTLLVVTGIINFYLLLTFI